MDKLQQVKEVLRVEDFSGIKKYLRETKKSHVLIAKKNKEHFFSRYLLTQKILTI